MFKDGTVLTVICLIVVGGIFAWWQTSTHFLNPTVGYAVQETKPTPPPPLVARRTVGPKRPVLVEPPAIVDGPVAVGAIPVVRHDPPPFPAVEQVPTGVHEDSVTGTYGDPALSTVTSTGGHTIETFVYTRGRGQSATVIRVEDGKVAGAYSQSEPVLPPGLSAPRRWHNQ
jgi:hypothetical protein